MIFMVMCMSKDKNNKIIKWDIVSRDFLILSYIVLGSFFIAACTYMLTLISDSQKENQYIKNDISKTVKNQNLVSM